MEVIVNDKAVSLVARTVLGDYLESADLSDSRGIAVAVNECVIARKQWPSHVLKEHDKVLIIRATQGG